jgi:hypothetical protein
MNERGELRILFIRVVKNRRRPFFVVSAMHIIYSIYLKKEVYVPKFIVTKDTRYPISGGKVSRRLISSIASKQAKTKRNQREGFGKIKKQHSVASFIFFRSFPFLRTKFQFSDKSLFVAKDTIAVVVPFANRRFRQEIQRSFP